MPGLPADNDRAQGIEEVLADTFNCLGLFSDAAPAACGELRFAGTELRARKGLEQDHVA